MALTYSNRETFLVLQWLEARPERRAHFANQASQLSAVASESAVPRLAGAILTELELELPELTGIAAEMLQSGLRRVAFYEIALGLLLEVGYAGEVPPTLFV